MGVGFDVASLAIDAFYDELYLKVGVGSSISLRIDGQKDVDIEKNTAKSAVELFLAKINKQADIGIKLHKGVPVSKGLGSSGASAAAAVFAINEAFGRPLGIDKLIDIAARSEGVISGTPHADNVAASLLGGFTFITSTSPFSAFSLKPKNQIRFYLAIPLVGDIWEKTRAARKALPEYIGLIQSIKEKANLLLLLESIIYGRYDEVGQAISLETPVDAARYESGLLPFYKNIKKDLIKEGALGVCVSGAGPSILVYKPGYNFGEVIKDTYKKYDLDVQVVLAGVAPPTTVIKV